MLASLLQLYTKLPEWVKASPAITLLIVGMGGFLHGDVLTSRGCQALRDADQKETTELRNERDRYRDLAFNQNGFLVERAQQAAKVSEEVAKSQPSKPKASPTPVVATLRVPVTPITAKEKQDIQKPADAQPETLNKSFQAAKEVLKKTDISKAQVQNKAP